MTLVLMRCTIPRSSMTPPANPRREGLPPTIAVGCPSPVPARRGLRSVRPLSAGTSFNVRRDTSTSRLLLHWTSTSLAQRKFTFFPDELAQQPLPSSPSPARRLREPARRRSPTTAMRHAARHGWTLSRRRNLAQTQTDTEGEAGLARAEHEGEVSVTTEARKAGPDRGGRSGQDGKRGPNQGKEEDPKRGSSRLDSATNEDMKTGTGRGGWLGQGGRHGHFQGQEEGPKRGSSRLADKVMDVGNKAGLPQEEMTVRTSDFGEEVGKDSGLAREDVGTAEAGGRQVTVLLRGRQALGPLFPLSPPLPLPPISLSLPPSPPSLSPSFLPSLPPPSSALSQRGHPAATDPCCPRAARARPPHHQRPGAAGVIELGPAAPAPIGPGAARRSFHRRRSTGTSRDGDQDPTARPPSTCL